MTSQIQHESAGALKPEMKWVRVLRALLNGPLNRFQAELYPISDHVLNSTIAELKHRGLMITARIVRLPGYGGRGANVAEYSLAAEAHATAIALIESTL